MKKRFRFIWLLPVFAAIIASLAVFSARAERKRIADAFERLTADRAASLAELMKTSAATAADALSLLFDEKERRLNTAARHAAESNASELEEFAKQTGAVLLAVVKDKKVVSWTGEKIPPGVLPSIIKTMIKADDESLVEGVSAAESSLSCVKSEFEDGFAVACEEWGADEGGFNYASGLAALLNKASSFGALYVVIQDKSGIVASSPNAPKLSSFSKDAWLAEVFTKGGGKIFFRENSYDDKEVYEGAGTFPMPDGGAALIRIGVQNGELSQFRERSNARHAIIAAAFFIVFLLSLLAASLIARMETRREENEKKAAALDAENKRQRALGEMAATVAHEVRNPLSTISMAAKRLAREFEVKEEEKEEFAELAGLIKSQTERVNRVITDFLELGRPMSISRARFKAAEFIESRIMPPALQRAKAEKKNLTIKIDDGCKIYADPNRLEQAISNLLNNALDACAEGGFVEISAEKTNSGTRIAVKDDGTGMDAETLAKAEEPFFTLKAKGTGLGLPLARRIIAAHGGTLTLKSKPQAGTEAAVELPNEDK